MLQYNDNRVKRFTRNGLTNAGQSAAEGQSYGEYNVPDVAYM